MTRKRFKLTGYKKQKIAAFICLFIVLANPVLASAAETVEGLRIINNTEVDSDYKLNDKEVEKIRQQIRSKADYQEIINDDAGRDIAVNDTKVSYLIENNILSREGTIDITDEGIKVNKDGIPIDGNMSKSEFMMALYKAMYGPISSRPIARKRYAMREGMKIYESKTKPHGYTGNGKDFDYSPGDYDVYASPNVVELYLAEWLNKSIIEIGELLPLTEREVRSRSAKIKPAWSNKLGAIIPGEKVEQSTIAQSSPWGDSFDFPGYPNPDKNLRIVNRGAQYFVNEEIQTIDALFIVEEVLRLTEKDLSEMEANIVAYKFGTSYLQEFPKDIRPTITYLIAMGVLDFENPGEFGHIYERLSNEFAYTLLYRLKNKSGRKDFSKIQLNDTDEQLMHDGLVEQELKVESGLSSVLPETLSVTTGPPPDTSATVTIANNVLNKLGIKIQKSEVTIAAKQASTVGYNVVKYFSNTSNIRYRGTRVKDLEPGKYEEINNIEDVDGGARKITFTIHAPSSMQALASVDSRITITDDTKDVQSTINTMTAIDTNKGKYSYISAKELGQKFSEIVMINSKTLKNRVTGDRAMLLEENDLALVGNTVIKSKDVMVKRINGIEYYNLAMIMPLMTNAFISKLDPMKLYINIDLPKEECYASVKGAGGELEKVPIVKLGTGMEVGENPFINQEEGNYKYFYNVNLLTKGVSTLIRDFDINVSGATAKCKMIINWSYSLPRVQGSDKLIEDTKIKKMAEDDKGFTIKESTEYLYTRPTDPARRDWWDNNIGLSNALANLVYDTYENPVKYVSSGYLAPNIDILVPDNTISEDRVVAEIFRNLRLSSSYVSKFCQGDRQNFYKTLFNRGGNTLSARRSFHIYRAKQVDASSNFASYADNYVTYPTGAVYRRCTSDPRFRYIHDGKNDRLLMHTRTKEHIQSDIRTDINVQVWTPEGYKEFFFAGYSGDAENAKKEGTYLKLIPLEPIEGQAKKQKKDYWTITQNGKDAIDEYFKEFQKVIPAGMMRRFDNDANQQAKKTAFAPHDNYDKAKVMKQQYVIGGKLYDVEKLSKKDKKNPPPLVKGDYKLTRTNQINKTQPVTYAFPIIYLKRSEFKFKDGKLIMERTNPYLEQGNVFYSGINNTLISRILDQDGVSVNLNKVPNGARVIIQDIVYTKKGKHLVSDPITTDGFATSLKNAEDNKAAEKEILNLYQGLVIDYSGRKEEVTGRNNQDPGAKVPFTSYVKSAEVGELLDKSKADGTMYKDSKKLMYVHDPNTKKEEMDGQSPKSAPVDIVRTNDLKFRKIDKSKPIYELVTSSDKYSEGYINDTSMFYETLDLSESDDLYSNLIGNRFAPVENAGNYIKDFLNQYKDALLSDTKTMLKFWIVIFISYFYVISWVSFLILKFDVGRPILTSLKEASGGWCDLVKLFTFGLLNLNSEMTASKLFVGNIMLTFLLAYVFRWL